MNNVVLDSDALARTINKQSFSTNKQSLMPRNNSSSTVVEKYNIKKMNKKFKALMIDCDGTLIPHEREALPSKKVTNAINQAANKIHIGLATSRSLKETTNIAKHLNLTGPSILNGGARIVDFKTGQTLWENPINKKVAKKVAAVCKKNFSPEFLNDPQLYISILDDPNKKFYNMYCPAQPEENAKKILKNLKQFDGISASYVPSWTKGKFDVLVYQSLATKQHGIFEVAKLLNIEPKDFIVIGDGYNDFPLLEAAGFGVAMGNASDELKAIADYIAPTVYDDGVADVIERFVLNG